MCEQGKLKFQKKTI